MDRVKTPTIYNVLEVYFTRGKTQIEIVKEIHTMPLRPYGLNIRITRINDEPFEPDHH